MHYKSTPTLRLQLLPLMRQIHYCHCRLICQKLCFFFSSSLVSCLITFWKDLSLFFFSYSKIYICKIILLQVIQLYLEMVHWYAYCSVYKCIKGSNILSSGIPVLHGSSNLTTFEYLGGPSTEATPLAPESCRPGWGLLNSMHYCSTP